ncbi:MAG TPA: Asp23/Gls24 family envelope stress response protein [Clostridia bacterium]|nr:Asp23/Gls24 family envelope stress response protein [Clostridia bacterium]
MVARVIEEDLASVPIDPTPGRSLVTRRAVVDLIRAATLGSYGVTGFAGGGLIGRLRERLGVAPRGLRVAFADRFEIELDLTVAFGLPVAEVARQVDSAVRYAIRRALDREVDRLTIHVDGLRYQPGGVPPAPPASELPSVTVGDLADSGTDVA